MLWPLQVFSVRRQASTAEPMLRRAWRQDFTHSRSWPRTTTLAPSRRPGSLLSRQALTRSLFLPRARRSGTWLVRANINKVRVDAGNRNSRRRGACPQQLGRLRPILGAGRSAKVPLHSRHVRLRDDLWVGMVVDLI